MAGTAESQVDDSEQDGRPRLPPTLPLVRVMAMPADANPNGDIFGGWVKTGRTSITVHVEAWRRHLPSLDARKVTEATFTYVAIGENRRPRPLPPVADA
jgi:acyl-CoA hydrolase